MADYQLTATEVVIRTVDQVYIPNDPDNRDRAEYDRWVDDGGVPDPYVAPPAPEPTAPPPDAVVVQMKYRAKTITQVMADPGNGFLIWNTPTQVDASKLAVAARDDSNLDQGSFFRNPAAVGRYFIIQNSIDSAQFDRFEIKAVIDNGTWFELGVSSVLSGGAIFSGNNPLYVLMGSPGASVVSPSQHYVTQEQFAELQAEVTKIADAMMSGG